MERGLFITIEGPDGSGKSTQIERIREYLRGKGKDVIITREPGGTKISEKIRQIILDKNNEEMVPLTEALLYAASRAQHVAEVIKPALEKGEHVICDRFVDSSMAYQGYGRRLGNCVWDINQYAVQGCMPDITFLMKVDPQVGKNRIDLRDRDRIEQEDLAFHNKVFEGYKELEAQYPNRIIGVDGNRTVEEISRDILGHIERLLE